MPSWASPRRAAAAVLARCPVGHLPVLDLGSTQTANSRPATGPQSAPAGCGTVSDIAGADGDRASLRIVEMRSQHGTISRRKFGPTRDADYHNLIGEDRRLLRLIGQECVCHEARRTARPVPGAAPPTASADVGRRQLGSSATGPPTG